ncbi:sugar kinase [Streptomyces sp. NPDC099088]|uniref:sugar kinase n=1 Tax=Streptomyces sp. NPDC099088 TaxID=3366101 RepID=UPI0038275D7B
MTDPWRPPCGRVVCVGETMAALAPDSSGPLADADHLSLSVAGAESNVAMYLADHGIPATWLSALGDDPLGTRVRAVVAAAGVDVTHVSIDPDRPTGLMLKNPTPAGTQVHYYRTGSAASALGPDLLEHEAMRAAALVHFTGITPALSASCCELVTHALAVPAAERPYAISFDVNHRPPLWPEDTAPKVLRDLARRADIVFVGLDEAQDLWGAHLTAAAVRELLPAPRIVVVKDGSREATVFTASGTATVSARRAAVVEPVGAGDAFAAGFLAGLLQGEPMRRSLRLGHITAVSALSVTGDHGPLPPRPSIDQLLALTDERWERGRGPGDGAGRTIRS